MKKKYHNTAQSIAIGYCYWQQCFFNSVLVLVIAILLCLGIGIGYCNTFVSRYWYWLLQYFCV